MKAKLWARLNAFPICCTYKRRTCKKNSQAKVGGALPLLCESWGGTCPLCPHASRASGDFFCLGDETVRSQRQEWKVGLGREGKKERKRSKGIEEKREE